MDRLFRELLMYRRYVICKFALEGHCRVYSISDMAARAICLPVQLSRVLQVNTAYSPHCCMQRHVPALAALRLERGIIMVRCE